MARVRNLILSFIFMGFCGSCNLWAQDSVVLRKAIETLSSNEFYGRGNCYDGEHIAAEWLRSELASLPNTRPMCENGFQKYAFNAFIMEGAIHLRIDKKELNQFTEYKIAPFSQTTHVQGVKIIKVDASLLVDTPAFEGFVMKNRAALKESFVYIDSKQWKHKIDAMQISKAIKTLQNNNPFQSKGIIIGVDELPIWSLNNTDFERNYAFVYVLRKSISRKSKTVTFHCNNEFFKKQTQNVCFAIEGSVHPDEFVVFTAHYDHLGCMGDSVIFHGAHDNASGTAAVVDFARYYSQNAPAYTTVFLLFSGEESGLRGSSFFVKHPLVTLDKIKMLLNLDMFCGGDDGIMVVNSTVGETKNFVDMMDTINAKNHYITAVKRRANAANSDHYYFSKYCPAIFIYTMGGKYGDYHNYTDTCESCGLNNYSAIFTLIRETLKQYLNN